MKRNRPLLTVRQPFALFERICDVLVARYLRRRAARNLARGHPPVAIFAFDYIGQEISLFGVFEREQLDVLFQFLLPKIPEFKSATALDIGANIGNHSLYFAPMFRKVHAFEPHPRTFKLLALNASLVSNVKAHNVGLGGRKGTMSLKVDPLNVGEASLLGFDCARGRVSEGTDVRIEKLDDMSIALGRVAFVKIDVEGFEASVLRGACALIQRNRPIIALEQNVTAFSAGESEALAILRSMGYRFCLITKGNSRLGKFMPIKVLRKWMKGVEFEIALVDSVPPDNYPMIIALPENDVYELVRSTESCA